MSAPASDNAQKNANPIRDGVVDHLLQNDVTDDEARDIEVGIFNWAVINAEERSVAKSWKNPAFQNLYVSKAKSVAANIDARSPVGNARLITRIREGEFMPHDIAFMKPQHVFPERWKRVLDLKLQKDEYIYNEKPASMTDQFKCVKCKKNECIYQELQLRSCDEPVSLFVTCLNCGNRWRIG